MHGNNSDIYRGHYCHLPSNGKYPTILSSMLTIMVDAHSLTYGVNCKHILHKILWLMDDLRDEKVDII